MSVSNPIDPLGGPSREESTSARQSRRRERGLRAAHDLRFQFTAPPILTPQAARALLDILRTHHGGDDSGDEAYSSAEVDQSGEAVEGEAQ